jgi:HSP20 family molecular chaperone IbpA
MEFLPPNIKILKWPQASVHLDERFAGCFRRVFTLSKELDSDKVSAEFNQGLSI